MIEVSLYSVPSKDINATVGTIVDRARIDYDKFGGGIMKFVKSFLKTNVHVFDAALGNPSIIEVINSSDAMTTKDLAAINYWLSRAGYLVKIQNVTDDEVNPTGPTGGTVEWNVIDNNFMEYGYPRATKIVPAEGSDVVATLKQVIDASDIFSEDRFPGVKNPFTDLLSNLEKVKSVSGSISAPIVTKIYEILDQVGIKVFITTGE